MSKGSCCKIMHIEDFFKIELFIVLVECIEPGIFRSFLWVSGHVSSGLFKVIDHVWQGSGQWCPHHIDS